MNLPAWPDPASSDGAAFFVAARKFHALYRSAGAENPFAFGMMTQAEAESSFNCNALGDFVDASGTLLPWSAHPSGTPTSFGAHQRKRDRTNIIRSGHGSFTGLGFDIAELALADENTVENEVRATLWELNAFPFYGLAAITRASTAYGAAYQATVTFERAGTLKSGAAEKRGRMAETWVMLASGVWPKARGDAPKDWSELTKGW